jgi:hypothetical protein
LKVPVTVIRPQKKKKAAHKRPVHAVPLSQSKCDLGLFYYYFVKLKGHILGVQSGQLAVDEVSKVASSPKSDTKTMADTTTKTTDKK